MLILAHLLGQNTEFRNHDIRVIRAVPNGEAREGAEDHLDKLVAASRIDAAVEVIVCDDLAAAIRDHGGEAAVTFIGFTPPEEGEHLAFLEHHERLTRSLGNVILVSSAEDVDMEA